MLVAWRLGVALVGALVVVTGIVLIPLPGPGWLIVFLGLSILATQFAWAARSRDAVKARTQAAVRAVRERRRVS